MASRAAPKEDAAPAPEILKGPPQITIANAGRHLPPARLGAPYAAKLECDADDGAFVAVDLPGGLKIAKDGVIAGTLNDIGPHRFEVGYVSRSRGRAWVSLAVSAGHPAKGEPAASTGAITADQVAAIVRKTMAANEEAVQQRIDEAVAAALAAREAAPTSEG